MKKITGGGPPPTELKPWEEKVSMWNMNSWTMTLLLRNKMIR